MSSSNPKFAITAFLFFAFSCTNAQPVIIGSKKFTESYVLGEIAKRQLNDAGIAAEQRSGMGGTIILWQALRGAQIDIYPEYTGTIAEEILKDRSAPGRIRRGEPANLRDGLAKFGVGMTERLGFNNTYALVMRRANRHLPGVHRHDCRGNSEGSIRPRTDSPWRTGEPARWAGKIRRRDDRAPRIQQHLRAQDAARSRAFARDSHDQRIAKSSGVEVRVHSRIFGSRGWLATARRAVPIESTKRNWN